MAKWKGDQPQIIGCTRVADMTQMHPDQIEMECANCHAKVGVYPSGQRALKQFPKMKPYCIQCVMGQAICIDEFRPAASPDEILQEMRESKPVINQ